MDTHQVRELLQRYQEGNCTPSENKLIESWYQQLIETGEWQWGKGERDMTQKMLENHIMKQIKVNDTPGKIKLPIFLLPRVHWWAAASVILLLGAFGYFMFYSKSAHRDSIVKVLPNDIKAPQSSRAVITLSNGQKVFLDSAGHGALAIQGNVKLVKLPGGEIAYQNASGEISKKIEYNTLSNQRGSKVVNMILADGSKVWLNAGSTLTYPVAFVGNERKVSITGEAYFEVAHDDFKPFVVSKGSVDIRVLGTHFNVNAFEDDGPGVKITLLEGSVKIINGAATSLLKPGQQARINSEIKILNDVDLDAVLAWKNDRFIFNGSNIQSVMKQLSRWYNVNVSYQGNVTDEEFVGVINRSRHENISQILKMLEKTRTVSFVIDGHNVTVMPFKD